TTPPVEGGATDPGSNSTSGTDAPTSLPFVTTPGGSSTEPADPAASGSVLMLKLYVGDMSASDAFYSTVLGAKLVAEMGAGVHIMTFPGGGPGVLLIQAGPDDESKQGSFIFKVA